MNIISKNLLILNLREPVKTRGRVYEMQTLVSEKPAIERTRHPSEKTWSAASPKLFLQFVLEVGQGPENRVKVIPWKVIQKHLILG